MHDISRSTTTQDVSILGNTKYTNVIFQDKANVG